MEITDSDIKNTCGPQPAGITYSDPGNDPNFVFTNDPNFEVVSLFDVEGNIVNVNSWLECIHYLKGGWTSTQILSSLNEQYLLISLISISFICTLLVTYFSKITNDIK